MKAAAVVFLLCCLVSTAVGDEERLYEVSADLPVWTVGSEITGEWRAALGGTSASDALALYPLGGEQACSAAHATGGSVRGRFQLQSQCGGSGHYVVRYLYAGNVSLAASAVLTVHQPGSSLTLLGGQSAVYTCGGTVPVDWQVQRGDPGRLCLYQPGAAAPLQSIEAASHGSADVPLPVNVGAQLLELRYVVARDEQQDVVLAVSELFSTRCDAGNAVTVHVASLSTPQQRQGVVGSAMVLAWSVQRPGADDWVGVYPVGVPPGSGVASLRWQYVNGAAAGSMTFLAPSLGGAYAAYYFVGGGYNSSAVTLFTLQQPAVACLPAGRRSRTAIEHVVVVCTENHSFDSYMGAYCQAPTGTRPTCSTPSSSCCAAAPATVSGATPAPLTDDSNLAWDPDHSAACELCEINVTSGGGLPSGFVQGCDCSSPRNFAVAAGNTAGYYHQLAQQYALADAYYQPAAGASSENDMYLARAAFVFWDNDYVPDGVGSNCYAQDVKRTYYDPNVAALLQACNVSFGVYAGGYAAAAADPASNPCWPRGFDGSDIPFEYYFSTRANYRDYDQFAVDAAAGALPNFAFLKPLGTHCEHPGVSTITAGEEFTRKTLRAIASSPLANSTLVLVVPDEGGGYFDHQRTPPTSPVDQVPYGVRLPFWALGHFAKQNYVSHVQLEHSSVVRFLEFNFLAGAPGQLGTRDAFVNNIGDLLDPEKTGAPVP